MPASILPIFTLFIFILLRMTALLAVAPLFAGGSVPVRFRVMLAAAVSVMLCVHQMPAFLTSASLETVSVTAFLVAGANEILLGATLGACVLMVFSAFSVAGTAVSYASGLSFPVESGMARESQTVITQILYALGTAAVFAFGGHRMILAALIKTFVAYPPGVIAWQQDMFQAVMEMFYLGFYLGVHIALPVLCAVLAAQALLAFLHRAVPQINAFAMSFPLNALLALGVLALTLGGGFLLFESRFTEAISDFLTSR